MVEQLAQVHNSTAKEALERFCGYLPEKWTLQDICFLISEIFGPSIIKMIERKMNADVACHALQLCKQEAGQPFCHLYPLPKVSLTCKLEMRAMQKPKGRTIHYFFQHISKVILMTLPYEDFDGDKFSIFPTLRGYYWRGRDCDDADGVDPKDGIPYEQKFCTESKGVIILGDSASAHFHIPPEWVTASQMSRKAFSNLPEALPNELDWPQFSEATGFLNSTIGGWTESIYLQLLRRNRCNHRDYQNLSKNDFSFIFSIFSLARNQQFDKPAIVFFSMVGNDVCNGYPDTVKHMTQPEKMRSNVLQTLRHLDSHLPKGSHVILIGLVDGRFLWDNLHKRYHPLGQLNKDVTYEQFYSFLSCLRVSSSQLSDILKEIEKLEKFTNFDLFYMDYPIKEITEMLQKMGGEAWQLIEPVDGFHPSQIASALGARIVWNKILHKWPHVLGQENPFNNEIAMIFKHQGGH
uniref:Acyloxyacyl hydrolase n=1 Tax=Anolis carolinensis TaxID=28377 RepID=G1KUN1_ANOCA